MITTCMSSKRLSHNVELLKLDCCTLCIFPPTDERPISCHSLKIMRMKMTLPLFQMLMKVLMLKMKLLMMLMTCLLVSPPCFPHEKFHLKHFYYRPIRFIVLLYLRYRTDGRCAAVDCDAIPLGCHLTSVHLYSPGSQNSTL